MYSVYALCDPETFEVYYIGCSLDVQRRYLNHFQKSQRKSTTPKHLWLDYLRTQGSLPVLLILEENLKETDRWEREAYWITYYHKIGAPLTNVHRPNLDKPRRLTQTVYVIPSEEAYQSMKYIALAEAAKQLGVSRGTLHYYIRVRKFETKKFDFDKQKYLKEEDFAQLKQIKDEARDRGRAIDAA